MPLNGGAQGLDLGAEFPDLPLTRGRDHGRETVFLGRHSTYGDVGLLRPDQGALRHYCA